MAHLINGCRRLGIALTVVFVVALVGARAADAASEQFMIMIIDDEESLVLARGTVTPVFIRFEVEDSAVLRSLRFGQKISADLPAKRVSVDGTTVCCKVVQMRDIPAHDSERPKPSAE
jgi:hypothetical protein